MVHDRHVYQIATEQEGTWMPKVSDERYTCPGNSGEGKYRHTDTYCSIHRAYPGEPCPCPGGGI